MTNDNINERIARLRGWVPFPAPPDTAWEIIWAREGKQVYGTVPYTTDPALILELVEDKHIAVVWHYQTDEWYALAYASVFAKWSGDEHYGTAVASAWLAGEEEQ